MSRITIEWLVALAMAHITTLSVLRGLINMFKPEFNTLYNVGVLLFVLLILLYQNKNYGIKILNKGFFAFYTIYLLYVILYLTVLRVFPIDDLEATPHSFISFIFTYFPLFCFLLSPQTIIFNFDPKKYCIASFLLSTLPSLWYISFVGVDVIQIIGVDKGDDYLSFLTIGYSNLPVCILSLLCYEKFDKRKWISLIVACVIVFFSLYVIIITTRRGPLLWGSVVLWISYLYKKRNTTKTILLSIGVIFAVYFSLQTIINGVSTFAPKTSERLEAMLVGDSNGRIDDEVSEGVYNTALNQVVESPMLGSYYRILSSSSRYRGGYPHNLFLEILMTMGVIGFLPFMYFLLKTLRNIFKLASNPDNERYRFCVILFLILFFMLQTSGTIVVQVDFWLFFYLLLCSPKMKRYNKIVS